VFSSHGLHLKVNIRVYELSGEERFTFRSDAYLFNFRQRGGEFNVVSFHIAFIDEVANVVFEELLLGAEYSPVIEESLHELKG